jgi:carbamoylphosphate synthase large subunit
VFDYGLRGPKALFTHLRLAVGCLLDELKNDITRETPASFEPSINYVVTKIPRFAFEKFPQGAGARPPVTLTTQMKTVGEAMAIRPHIQGKSAEMPAR